MSAGHCTESFNLDFSNLIIQPFCHLAKVDVFFQDLELFLSVLRLQTCSAQQIVVPN